MDSQAKLINRKIQAIAGAVVFLIAFIVYFRCVAPTTSFWDCGEFIACSYILGVMHPPGAPLYLLIGRILTMLPFFKDIGLRVNIFSPFVSAGTILFAYLIIVQLIQRWRGEAKTWEDRLILFGSGAFGALAFAFTDSFWFNAEEAEVYAFSMFLAAATIWLALYWGERSKKAGNMLLIFFIFYLFGLTTGVHLLNILTFPFILLIAYFHENQSVKRLLLLIFLQVTVPITLYILFFQFDPSRVYGQAMLAHQAKAWSFLKWFGFLWVTGTMIYIYFKDRKAFKAWWVVVALVLVGYSTYLVIYVRAGLAPPINENNPSTLQGMMNYLARKQYGTESLLLTLFHRNADFWHYQIHKMYTRYFAWQFIGKGTHFDYHDRIIEIISFRGLYGLPFIVGLWGAAHHFSKDWKRALAVLVLFFIMGYAIIIYLNQPDPQPRERDYSYVGSFFAFALWIGIGMAGIFEWLSEWLKKKKSSFKGIAYGVVGILLFVAVPWNLYAFNYKPHNRTGNYVAYDYSYDILQSCEPNGIIFTNGDNDTFPLWFLQEVYGIRKDVRVVNLSLLNTPWYIKQLRDQEPKVPMNLSDSDINHLYYIRWKTKEVKIPLSDEVRKRVLKRLKAEGERVDEKSFPKAITFKLSPTYPPENPQVLRVQDLMVLRILEANQWQKPIYFAVTVSRENQLNLYRYLRMDGLAYNILPYPVKHIDPELLQRNILDKFLYRGLNDPKVHLNRNIIKLLLNCRQSFLQLAQYYITHNQKEKAAFILKEMEKRMPEEHIPYSDERIALMVADYYRRAGLPPEYEKRIKHVLPGRPVSVQQQLWLADYYSQVLHKWDRSEEIFRQLIQQNPNNVRAYSGLFHMYKISKQYNKGIQLLEDWMLHHPMDSTAKKELDIMKKLAASDTAGNLSPNIIPEK